VQLERFLATAAEEEPEAAPYWMLMGLAGLRPGEGLGVQWTDFDFVGREIQVQRTIQKDGTAKRLRRTVSRARCICTRP
jgi:integrase